MTTKLTLGYWGIRGRGQVTRLICAYTGIQWQQKTYTSPQQWFSKDKQQLGILFPNLPYIIDGELTISQSDVLPRYVIKKSGCVQLLGRDYRDMALVDNVIYVLQDIWMVISQLFFNKRCDDEKAGVFYQLRSKFMKLEKFINGKQTTLGYLTLADFVISEFSYYVEKLFPQEYQRFVSLQNVRRTVEGLEQVKKYYAREDAVQAVFLPPNLTVAPFYLEKFQPKLPPPMPTVSPMKKVKHQESINNNVEKLKIVLISGSLRKASTNSGLLRACLQLANPRIDFEWADISSIPMFSQDLQQKQTPQPVQKIRKQVSAAHGILFAVSQNNGSPAAALKNIYDWLSRGKEKSVIYKIPAGVISVNADNDGLRVQKAFRLIGEYCLVKFMESPVVVVNKTQGEYFDQVGNLVDEKVKGQLREYVEALGVWVEKNRRQ